MATLEELMALRAPNTTGVDPQRVIANLQGAGGIPAPMGGMWLGADAAQRESDAQNNYMKLNYQQNKDAKQLALDVDKMRYDNAVKAHNMFMAEKANQLHAAQVAIAQRAQALSEQRFKWEQDKYNSPEEVENRRAAIQKLQGEAEVAQMKLDAYKRLQDFNYTDPVTGQTVNGIMAKELGLKLGKDGFDVKRWAMAQNIDRMSKNFLTKKMPEKEAVALASYIEGLGGLEKLQKLYDAEFKKMQGVGGTVLDPAGATSAAAASVVEKVIGDGSIEAKAALYDYLVQIAEGYHNMSDYRDEKGKKIGSQSTNPYKSLIPKSVPESKPAPESKPKEGGGSSPSDLAKRAALQELMRWR